MLLLLHEPGVLLLLQRLQMRGEARRVTVGTTVRGSRAGLAFYGSCTAAHRGRRRARARNTLFMRALGRSCLRCPHTRHIISGALLWLSIIHATTLAGPSWWLTAAGGCGGNCAPRRQGVGWRAFLFDGRWRLTVYAYCDAVASCCHGTWCWAGTLLADLFLTSALFCANFAPSVDFGVFLRRWFRCEIGFVAPTSRAAC